MTKNEEAHAALVDAIMHAPKYVATMSPDNRPINAIWPEGAEAVFEVIGMAQRIPQPKEHGRIWRQDSVALRNWHSNWAERFGTVAQKLQAGARFAPSEVKGKVPENKLDPALHNVLADGWHHQPITQPLEP